MTEAKMTKNQHHQLGKQQQQEKKQPSTNKRPSDRGELALKLKMFNWRAQKLAISVFEEKIKEDSMKKATRE